MIINIFLNHRFDIPVSFLLALRPSPRSICKYSVFFFIEPKVFVDLTYLYLSEINNQGLIFFVLLGHLIIRSNK